MNIGKPLNYLEEFLPKSSFKFDNLLWFTERAKFYQKTIWEPGFNYSTTMTSRMCRLAQTFPEWPLKSQAMNLLHESTHMLQMEKNGNLAFYVRYLQKAGRLSLELDAMRTEVLFGKAIGDFRLIGSHPNDNLNRYIESEVQNLSDGYFLGSWFTGEKKNYVRSFLTQAMK